MSPLLPQVEAAESNPLPVKAASRPCGWPDGQPCRRVDARYLVVGGHGELAGWPAEGMVAPSPRPLPLEHGQDLAVAEPVPRHGQGPELVAADGHGSSWQMGQLTLAALRSTRSWRRPSLGRRREGADNEEDQGDQDHGPDPAAQILCALQHLPGDRIQRLLLVSGLPPQQLRKLQLTGSHEVERTLTCV
jgi:hypothetical protein